MEKIAIIIRGPAAVGKSSVALELKRILPEYALLSVDAFRHMVSKDSSDARREIARNTGRYFLEQVIEHGLSVILEEVFHDDYVITLKTLLEKNNYRIVTVFLTAPEVELQKRNAGREKVKSEETISKFSALAKPDKGDLVINTVENKVSEVIKLILDRLQ